MFLFFAVRCLILMVWGQKVWSMLPYFCLWHLGWSWSWHMHIDMVSTRYHWSFSCTCCHCRNFGKESRGGRFIREAFYQDEPFPRKWCGNLLPQRESRSRVHGETWVNFSQHICDYISELIFTFTKFSWYFYLFVIIFLLLLLLAAMAIIIIIVFFRIYHYIY